MSQDGVDDAVMTVIDDNAFLDQLYGAAVRPGLWVSVMERFADMIGGTGAMLSRMSIVDGSGSSITARVDPARGEAYLNYYGRINVLNNVDDAKAYIAAWRPRILTDEDWMPKDEFFRSEYYNDFVKPGGTHSVLMVRLGLKDEYVSCLSINRGPVRGQFDGADLERAAHYHPHLIRAFALSHRLAVDRELDLHAASVFDHAAHGLFLLTRDGRVLKLNPAAERMVQARQGLRVVGGRLSATNGDAARRLERLIADAAAPAGEGRTGGSMILSHAEKVFPLSVTVAPLRAEEAALFAREACALVCVTDLEAGVSVPERKLRDLFGLTPAEARLAMALFEGARVSEAATALGISINTANVHLGRIFEKTGANRQSALVGLMMRAVGLQLH